MMFCCKKGEAPDTLDVLKRILLNFFCRLGNGQNVSCAIVWYSSHAEVSCELLQ